MPIKKIVTYNSSPPRKVSKKKKAASKPRRQRPRNRVVNQPANRAVVKRYSAPVQRNLRAQSRAGCVIKHREKFVDVAATGNFTVQYFGDINPGISSMFPWLANEARNWEKFRFRSLRFCYEHWAATNRGGAVYLAIDHNPVDIQPATTVAMAAYYNCTQVSPSEDACSYYQAPGIDKNKLYMNSLQSGRVLLPPANSSINDYSIGKFILATTSIDTPEGYAPSIGEVWVEYEVELWFQEQQLTNVGEATTLPDRSAPGATRGSRFARTSASATGNTVAQFVTPSLANAAGHSLFPQGGIVSPLSGQALTQALSQYSAIFGGGTTTAALQNFNTAGTYVMNTITNAMYPISVSATETGTTGMRTGWYPAGLTNADGIYGQWDVNSNFVYRVAETVAGDYTTTVSAVIIGNPALSTFVFMGNTADTSGDQTLPPFSASIEAVSVDQFYRIINNALNEDTQTKEDLLVWDYSGSTVELFPQVYADLQYQNLTVEIDSQVTDGTQPFGAVPVLSNAYLFTTVAPDGLILNLGHRFSLGFSYVGTGLDNLSLTVSGGFTDYVLSYTFNNAHTALDGTIILTSPAPPGTTFAINLGTVPASATISSFKAFMTYNPLIPSP